MNRCRFCGYTKGGHDTNCPHPSPNLDTPRSSTPQLEEWGSGYRDGRSGKDLDSALSPVYQMGWVQGTARLEEAENAYRT